MTVSFTMIFAAAMGWGLHVPDSLVALFLILLPFLAIGSIGTIDMESWAAAFKELYPPGKTPEIAFADSVLASMVKKKSGFGAKYMVCPVKFGKPSRRSATFATASTNRGGSNVVDFFLRRKKDYQFITIDHETLLASKGNEHAFLSAQSTEIDDMLKNLGRSQSLDLWGDGRGLRGQFAADVNLAGDTATLRDPNQIVNFEVDQVIELYTDGDADVQAGTLTILEMDEDTGTLVFDDDISTAIPTATANDFLVNEGDFNRKMDGVAAWIPDSSVDLTVPFLGVNRSVHPTRLAGHRMALQGMPISEACLRLVRRLERSSGVTSGYLFLNDVNYIELERERSDKIVYNDPGEGVHANFGFKGFAIIGKKGMWIILRDSTCPADRIYALDLDSWELHHLGEYPAIFDTDGLPFLRASGEDGIDVQSYAYSNLRCIAPGKNAVGEITPPAYV